MTGRIEPQRALALPYRQEIRRFAGAAAFVAGAARPVILRGRRRQIVAEAKAFIRKRNRAVRITFALGDAVAEPGDEDVADRHLGCEPLASLCAPAFLRHDGSAA